MSWLELESLTKIYEMPGGRKVALDGVSLSIERGELLSVVGRSGSGKTTLLRLLAGLTDATSGSVKFSEGRRPRIGTVFQEPRLMPWMTVEANIAFSDLAEGSRRDRKERMDGFLSMLGLKDLRNAMPHQLSGGMAQRTALGRALWCDPDLVLMDEPLSSLDYLTRLSLRDEIARLHEARGDTTVLVTHDAEEAVWLSDRVVVLSEGRSVNVVAVDAERPRRRGDSALQKYVDELIDTIIS